MDPGVEFADITLECEQFLLGFDKHLSDMLRRCWAVDVGEYDDLFYHHLCGSGPIHQVDVGMQQKFGAERRSERIYDKIIEHVVVLHVSSLRPDIRGRMDTRIVDGHLSVVCQQIPCGAVSQGDGDELVPVEAKSAIPHIGEEDG